MSPGAITTEILRDYARRHSENIWDQGELNGVLTKIIIWVLVL